MTEKFVVPFFNGAKTSLAKDDNGKPLLFGKEAVEEINKPIRDLINANDRRRDNAKSI